MCYIQFGILFVNQLIVISDVQAIERVFFFYSRILCARIVKNALVITYYVKTEYACWQR